MTAEQKVLDVLEAQVDSIEQALDAMPMAASEAVRYVRTNPLVFVAVGAVSGAAGALIAYKIVKRKLEFQFEERLAEEIQATKDFYGAVHKTEFATPEEAVKALIPEEELREQVRDYQGRPSEGPIAYDKIKPEKVVVEVIKEETVTAVTANVFESTEWNWDRELAERKRIGPEEPYVLHFDEFMQNEPDYQQNTLTYYVEDDTLADEKEEIVHDVFDAIGDKEILGKFGHGSNDPRTLYIRNPRLDLDFEVVLSEKSYSQDVLGFTPEEAPPGRRRTRRESAGE